MSVLLINDEYAISKQLALESTIIQDMISDCQEFPKELTIPNLTKDLDLTLFKHLEKLSQDHSEWIELYPDSSIKCDPEPLLKIAIRFDMRRLISLLIYYYKEDFYEKYLSIPNILKACLEHCNGYSYHIIDPLREGSYPKTYACILTHIHDFPSKDTKSGMTLICVVSGCHSSIIVHEHGYIPVLIHPDNFDKYNITLEKMQEKMKAFIKGQTLSPEGIQFIDFVDLAIPEGFEKECTFPIYMLFGEYVFIHENGLLRLTTDPRNNKDTHYLRVLTPVTKNAYFLDQYYVPIDD